jgi:putative membrane protein
MNSLENKTNNGDWHRLSVLSVIFFIGKTITHLVKDALPAMAPLLVIAFTSDNKIWVMSLIAIGAVTLTLISSFLQFWFFQFKVEKNRVLINDGVFKKNHRIIQFDRIQNINVLQPLYFRPFELVTLQIETAGAKGNEADLAGLPSDYAEHLRHEVLQYQTVHQATTKESDVGLSLDEPPAIATAGLLDLVKYGVSSNGIFWFFVVIAPLVGMGEKLIGQWINKDDFNQLASTLGGGVTGTVLMVSGLVVSVIFLMLFFSIIGAIFRYFKYQLTLNRQTLKRSSGLLTNYQESLKLAKIQAVISQTNFIGNWLKVVNLTLGQISNSQKNQQAKKSLFVVPARTRAQDQELKNLLLDSYPNDIPTQGISRRYINKTVMLKLFIPSSLLCIPAYFASGTAWVFLLPFLVSLLLLPLVIKRWKAYRFGMKNGYGKFERGLFGFRHIVFPLHKVQKVEVRQSPIQRRKNLATLKIYLASNRIQMQYISLNQANHWMRKIMQYVQTTKGAWY